MIPQHSSESNEQYSPEWLVSGARQVLGNIDLDPASSAFANQMVKASYFYTAEQNGLLQDWGWAESIFLNPPGGLVDENCRVVIRANNKRQSCTETGDCGLPPGHKHMGVTSSAGVWWRMLGWWWNANRNPKARAIFVLFSMEQLQTTQKYLDVAHPLDFVGCLPKERIDFDKAVGLTRVPGGQPTHANLIVLLTWELETKRKFRDVFTPKGKILVPGESL